MERKDTKVSSDSKLQISTICSIRIRDIFEDIAKNEFFENRKCATLYQGLELDRAKGGVSFIYDEPPSFERWQEKREKKIKEIEGIF